MLRTIIVDDEPKARRIMCTLVEQHCEDIQVLGTTDDVPSAVKMINKLQPDLVFLDIEMPGYTGFQLLDFFEEVNFQIIFTTAYSEYAIQAFQVSAIDYLLKPIEITPLRNAVKKAMDQQMVLDQNGKIEALKANLNPNGTIKKVALPVADGLILVEPEDILYLKADGSYTNILLADGQRLLVTKKIKEFDRILKHPCFFKSHRSFLINLNRIKQYIRHDGGYIVMSNGDQVSLARDRKDEFLTTIST
jgi:two-component system LytT family response regulator